jgi:hypothetical protein
VTRLLDLENVIRDICNYNITNLVFDFFHTTVFSIYELLFKLCKLSLKLVNAIENTFYVFIVNNYHVSDLLTLRVLKDFQLNLEGLVLFEHLQN